MSLNFKEIMKSKNDRELLDVVDSKNEYLPEAINAAKQELKSRGGINKLKSKNDELHEGNQDKKIEHEEKPKVGNTANLFLVCSLCDYAQSRGNKKCTKCDSVLSKDNTTRICPKCCFKKNNYRNNKCSECLWDLNEEYTTQRETKRGITSIIKGNIKHHQLRRGIILFIIFIVYALYVYPASHKTNDLEVEIFKKDLKDVQVDVDDPNLFSFNGGAPSSETWGFVLDIAKEFTAKMEALQSDYDLKIKSIGQTELVDIQYYVDLQKLNGIRAANVSERDYTEKYFDDLIALISSYYDRTDERFGESSPGSVTCPSLTSLMEERKTLTLANIDSYISLLDSLIKNNAQIYIEQGQLVSENNTVLSELNSINKRLDDLSKENEALDSKYTTAMNECLTKFNKAKENISK